MNKEIGIPLPKGYKLIVVVAEDASQKQVDEFGTYLNEFNHSNDAILMIKESLIKQIYLVEKAELKEKMSEQITNEQYTQSMYLIQIYMKQMDRVIELEGLQNILVKIIQDINRQIVKVKDYERIQAECQKEIDRLKLLRRD